MTLLLLAAVLSTAPASAMQASCCIRRAPAHAASPVALAPRVPLAPRDKTAVRTEAPAAAPVAAYCASPQRRACAAYLRPALAPRAGSAAPRSERAPPSSLA